MNPQMIIQMIKQGQNPQQIMLEYLQQTSGSPVGQNLLNLAKNGQTQEIEKVVRNLYLQQGGKDFDKDLMNFRRNIGL